MILAILLVAFIAGLACGLALRPGLDRRRQLRRAYAVARERRRSTLAPLLTDGDLPAVPRDYYHTDRRQGGTLAEGYGLQRRAGDHADNRSTAQTELDFSSVAMPRDYYERETPDDEGTLSEGYGLRGGHAGKSAGPA
ncbi:MAG: hypothetical protein ACOY33_01585 [Pseudomonadota bacterium]